MRSATKSTSLESKQYFDEHKESTKSELEGIRNNATISDKQKKALVGLLLDDVKAKQETEDFKKNAEVRKTDYKKIRELVIERVGDPKQVTKEDVQEAVAFFYGEKPDTKESKEVAKKSLEFESDTFKIDSTDWKEVTKADKNNSLLAKFVGKEPKVKVNATGDVVEYLE